jgi:2-keto-3-deoxy-L-rhamnonate aldolase RhmA
MLSTLGFDFLFLDLEHGAIDNTSLALHSMASSIPIMARLADSTELCVKHAADAGADYLVVPHVRNARMAADVVSWATYPPSGTRSVGLSRNTMLGYKLAATMADPSRPVVIAQIEDVEGLANVKEICATPGLGGLFIGPFDLSASLGAPGDVKSLTFTSAVETITVTARDYALPVGIFSATLAAWQDFRILGCDYVVLGSETLYLIEAATRALERARSI